MRKIAWGIIPLLVCLLFTGCKDDELAKRVEEGLPVSLTFRMSVPKSSDVNPMTRASDEVETNVEKLALIFYKYENSQGQVVEVASGNIKKLGEVSTTHYTYQITITADEMTAAGIYSGSYVNVFAIANWDKGFCTVNLDDVKNMSMTALKDYCVLKTNNQIDLTETALLLTGEYGPATLESEGQTVLTGFHLKRLTAKISFKFINGTGANFIPTEYEIYNYSRSSTLIERTGWTKADGSGDDTSGTNPGSLTYKAADSEDAFANSTSPIQITTGDSIGFYMLENVQMAKVNIEGNDWRQREKNTYAGDEKSFINAPEKGTYVKIRGTYNGRRGGTEADAEEEVSGTVEYTIHLGDFSEGEGETGSINNYTVRRNVKYHYDVTVTGVNSIIVEATTTTNEDPNPAAEGDILKSTENVYTLDSHFETVMLEIPYQSSPNNAYTLMVVTPYGNFTQNTAVDGNAQAIDSEHLEWIKFGKPASTTTFANYPGDGKFKSGSLSEADYTDDDVQLVDIYGLMSAIQHYASNPGDSKFYTVVGDVLYVTAYVDEYYYDKETNRSKFINANDRQMSLASRTSISADRHSTYTQTPIFNITQHSIKSVFDMTDESIVRPFGVEVIEETESAYLNQENTEQSTRNDPLVNWGWRNLWEQLGGYQDNPQEFTWDRYVNIAANGYLNNTKNQKMAPMQSGYEYGLYQCYSRNRDENGDGKIDIDEMKWFLPAIQECTSLTYGIDVLPREARFTADKYYSSTNGQYRIWYAKEGTAFGDYSQGGPCMVRCIRIIDGFGEVQNEYTASVSSYDATNHIVTLQGMGEEALRSSNSQVGEYLPHNLDESANKLPQAFQIATNELSVNGQTAFTYEEVRNQNLCANNYQENGNDLGQWRIPNEKELTLMFRHYKTNTGIYDDTDLWDYTAGRSTYTRVYNGTNVEALFYIERRRNVKVYINGVETTRDLQVISSSWGIGGGSSVQNNWGSFRIRCVRDAQPQSAAR